VFPFIVACVSELGDDARPCKAGSEKVINKEILRL